MNTFYINIKTLLLVLMIMFGIQILSAQDTAVDTIYTIDEKGIPAKVMKIGDEFVIYQDPNLEGVDLSIKIGRVDRIVRSNGDVDQIREATAELEEPTIKFVNPKKGKTIGSNEELKMVARVYNVDDKESISVFLNNKPIEFTLEGNRIDAYIEELEKGENKIRIEVDHFGETIKNEVTFLTEKKKGNLFSIGVKAGAIMNNYNFKVNGDKANGNVDGKIGLAAGLQIEKPLSPAFNLRLEGLYTQRGYNSTVYDFDAELEANYLEVALLGIFKFLPESKVNPFISVGPSMSFMLGSGTAKVNGEELEVTFKKSDFGLSAGVGAYINQNIVLEGRYIHGFSNIESTQDVDLINEETFTQNIIIGLSYFFAL